MMTEAYDFVVRGGTVVTDREALRAVAHDHARRRTDPQIGPAVASGLDPPAQTMAKPRKMDL
jgi:hypothetical protein